MKVQTYIQDRDGESPTDTDLFREWEGPRVSNDPTMGDPPLQYLSRRFFIVVASTELWTFRGVVALRDKKDIRLKFFTPTKVLNEHHSKIDLSSR